MPRKKPSILSLEPIKTKVNITLQKSNLDGDDDNPRLYGSISRKKVTVRSVIAEMSKRSNLPLSKELMFYVAEELSSRMMEKFKEGYSVELLDFGTIYPTMKGSIKQHCCGLVCYDFCYRCPFGAVRQPLKTIVF